MDQMLFRRKAQVRGALSFALGLALAVGAAGCTTASIEDAAPVAATAFPPTPGSGATVAPVVAEPPVAAQALQEEKAPRDTGRFPNLNVTPNKATEQITAADKEASVAELKAAQKRQAAGVASVSTGDDANELRELGSTHADDALKTIEQSN